jgi:hypothetical protein
VSWTKMLASKEMREGKHFLRALSADVSSAGRRLAAIWATDQHGSRSSTKWVQTVVNNVVCDLWPELLLTEQANAGGEGAALEAEGEELGGVLSAFTTVGLAWSVMFSKPPRRAQ